MDLIHSTMPTQIRTALRYGLVNVERNSTRQQKSKEHRHYVFVSTPGSAERWMRDRQGQEVGSEVILSVKVTQSSTAAANKIQSHVKLDIISRNAAAS